MTRYRGFFGKVRANLLLEQALKHGADCYGVYLNSSISMEVRRLVREHLNKPEVPQTKEEVFFALAVYAVPLLDAETLLWLYQDLTAAADIGRISGEVRGYFLSAVADLAPEKREQINSWLPWREEQETIRQRARP